MNYLKIFESFNDFYEEISMSEFLSIISSIFLSLLQ